ncbi:hypothetical protein AA0535_1421 [Asaia krungthepensis NRIC 0535]|uniref:Uncharacterized protein n=1 Tax=Asaia krungthepensis NRIC 0535 TaxID=1307925 RepID=A0ABQ0Q2B7_9PROT|nr:hypothetical protein AA0535_1421 [Asaia krungthepensis NRIC 0535]
MATQLDTGLPRTDSARPIDFGAKQTDDNVSHDLIIPDKSRYGKIVSKKDRKPKIPNEIDKSVSYED